MEHARPAVRINTFAAANSISHNRRWAPYHWIGFVLESHADSVLGLRGNFLKQCDNGQRPGATITNGAHGVAVELTRHEGHLPPVRTPYRE